MWASTRSRSPSSTSEPPILTRGLERVKQEWLWLSTAFNLKKVIGRIRSGVDPPAECSETA